MAWQWLAKLWDWGTQAQGHLTVPLCFVCGIRDLSASWGRAWAVIGSDCLCFSLFLSLKLGYHFEGLGDSNCTGITLELIKLYFEDNILEETSLFLRNDFSKYLGSRILKELFLSNFIPRL